MGDLSPFKGSNGHASASEVFAVFKYLLSYNFPK